METPPPYVTGARPLTPQEEAFRRWMRNDGGTRVSLYARSEDDAETILSLMEAAFGAGWTARDQQTSR